MSASSDAKLKRYRLLVDMMAVLVSTHRADDVLAELHRRVGSLFSAPVTLLALRQGDGSWQCLTLEGQNIYRKTLFAQDDSLLERALNGNLTYTNDLFSYAQSSRLTLRSLDPDSRMPYPYSWMGVPLRLGDQLAGVLSLQSYEPGAFTDDDLEFLRLLSTHLGIAMENALLRERLETEARTDALTGLDNRRSFVSSGEQALAGGEPVTLAVMDVQSFKRINDDLGHPAGDAVLVCIGKLLKRHAAPGAQAFRLGGDEFALLLALPYPGAHARLRAFIGSVDTEAWPVSIPVRLNVGLAQSRPRESFEQLVHHADARMYDAKLRGVHLDPL